MSENLDSAKLMEGGRTFLIHDGKLILHWNTFKPVIGKIVERSVGDFGHMGRWFDNFPQHLVVKTRVKQKSPDRFVCKRSDVVKAVMDSLAYYISEIETHIDPKYVDSARQVAQKYMQSFVDELAYCKKGIMFNRKVSFEYILGELKWEFIYSNNEQ